MKKALLATTMLVSGAAFFVMADSDLSTKITALKDCIATLTTESEGIFAAADEEGRDLTAEELQRCGEIGEEITAKTAQLEARERIAASQRGPGRRSAAEPTTQNPQASVRVSTPAQPRAGGGKGGFPRFGDFAKAVRAAAPQGAQVDQRLLAVATTYGNEGNGADGGFAVPPDFRSAIWQKVMDEENLLTRCDQLETGSNNMTFPKDETTPWQTSGGIQVYWEAEASQVTQSKPALEMATMRLQKLMALVPVSEELLEDAPGIESWLLAKAPSKMAAKLNTAIVSGNGVGMPLGYLNAPSTLMVAEEASQTAGTVNYQNIIKMWAAMYAPCRRNAVWVINQDVEPQLDMMSFDLTSDTKIPVYLPAGGLSASPYATLKGRPVVPLEAASALGSKGDISLVDFTQYMTLRKAGQDIRTDVSMHLFFDQGLQAFRFTFRINGQPWWGKTMARQNSANPLSWAVTLADRA